MGEQEKSDWNVEVKPATIYKHALEAKRRVEELEKKIEKLTEAVVELSKSLNTSINVSQPATTANTALRPGRMIYNVLHEDEDEVVKEIICPHCGMRDVVREKPKTVKIEVPREVVPEGYIPVPRTTKELIELLENITYHDGKRIFEKPEAVNKIAELFKKYGYELRQAKQR